MEIKEPYTIINIPLGIEKDKETIKLIYKLINSKCGSFLKELFSWYKPLVKKQIINIAVIIEKNRKTLSFGSMDAYKDWFKNKEINKYMEIDYKDFLKYKKVSTIDLLKNYEKN